MNDFKKCESCGMPINNGTYCQYCTDENGNLQSFEERFENMVQWTMKNSPNMSREEVEQRTKAYMSTMPAWKNHPKLASH